MAGTLRLLSGTGRWVPPFLLVLVWVLFTLSPPGPSGANHTSIFAGLVIAAVWLTIVIGNLDDDPHRDLLAAAVGSTFDLHLRRAVYAGVLVGAVGLVSAVASTLLGSEDDKNVVESTTVGLALGVGAALIGVGIGTWLHRPILRHRGASTLVAIAAVMATMLFPPLQGALRAVNDGRAAPALAVLAAAVVWFCGSVVGASRVAQRLSH